MATDYYRKHSPPGRDVGKAKDCKTAGCKIRLIGIALVLTWLCVSGLFASGMSPVDPQYSGTTVSSHISHGDLVYHLTSPDLPCDHTSVTVFGNSYRTASPAGGYNVVAPVGSTLTALSVEFHDRDFFVSDDDEYTPWGDNNSKYTLSSSSYPFSGELLSEVYGSVLNSMGISQDLSGVPVGKYPVTLTVTDHGAPPRTGITDASSSFAFDLWVIDLAEKSGTISIPDEEVYEIDLTAIPGDFPHENVCYISVSWFGALPSPGQTVSSHLYTDRACNNAITEDSGSYCAKKWLYGDPDTPTRIYYKHPQDATVNDTIYVSLVVNNSPIIQKQLMFKKPSTAIAKYIDGIVDGYGRIRDYWDGSHMLFYPYTEWEDDDEDGYNEDRIGIVSDDSNRPFVFSLSGNNTYFRLNAAAFKALGNGTLSGSYSFSSAKYGFSGSGMVPGVGNEDCYWLPISSVYGNQFTKIDADTETIDWTIGNDYIRTKHPVYVIGGQLTEENDYHTLIDLGCKAARGLDNTNTAAKFTSIWNKYATLDIKRIDGEGPISYWGTNADITYHVGDVLSALTGRCGTWSDMFIKTCQLQGINTVGEISFETLCGDWILHQKGTSFQGGSIPTAPFRDHVINTYNGNIYDVTSGVAINSLLLYLINYIEIHDYSQPQYDSESGLLLSPYKVEPLTSSNIYDYLVFYLN